MRVPFVSARCALMLILLTALTTREAKAQIAPPGPPGPYAIDLRGSMVGIPQSADFYPTVPSGTIVPARGFGLDAGAHVYLFRLGPSRVGVGGDFTVIRATAVSGTTSSSPSSSSSSSSGSSSTTSIPVTTNIKATARLLTPQLSFNFGTERGWSYLSVGVGTAQIQTTVSDTTDSRERSVDSGSLRAINFGGGARWFPRSHLGVGFDLRFHKLAAGSRVDTPSATLFAAAAGLTIR